MKKMSKLAVAGSILAMSAAQAAPTLYGQINKEYRMVDQDNKAYVASVGLVDVENSESRFGFKGTEEIGAFKVNYALETGFNSSNGGTGSASTAGRIRPRQAYLNFGHAFGTLMLGQQSTLTAGAFGAFDPMAATVAGWTADDAQFIYDNATAGGLGFNNRSRRDLLGYKTPDFMGFSFATTLDRNDKNSTAAEHQTRDPMYWENLLTYKNTFGSVGMTAHVGYMKWNQQVAGGYHYNDEAQMAYGAEVKFMDFALAGTYTQNSYEKKETASTALARDFETTWMSFAASYKFLEKNSFAVTYAKKEVDEGMDFTASSTTKSANNSEETQLAFGLKHMYSDMLEMRLTYAMYDFERAKPLTTAETTADKYQGKTDASTIAIGTMLKF